MYPKKANQISTKLFCWAPFYMHRSNSKELSNCVKKDFNSIGLFCCEQFLPKQKYMPKSLRITTSHVDNEIGLKTLLRPRPISIFRYPSEIIAKIERRFVFPTAISSIFPTPRYSAKTAPAKTRVHKSAPIHLSGSFVLLQRSSAQPPHQSPFHSQLPSLQIPSPISHSWRKREKALKVNGLPPM